MRRIAAREARNRFGRLLDACQSVPVLVTRKDRPVSVLVSVAQYERLRGSAWEGLAQTIRTPQGDPYSPGRGDKRH